jgi:hypothetical protein
LVEDGSEMISPDNIGILTKDIRGCLAALVTFDGKCILVLTGEAAFFRAELGSIAHSVVVVSEC